MISAPHPPATPACRQAWSVTAHSAPWLVGLCLLILPAARPAHAQPTEQAPPAADMPRTTRPASDRPSSGTREAPVLPPVTVSGRREALDEAPPAYPGGQVGSETRLGLLGNTALQDTPFNATSYTARTVEDNQARSVADVMIVDPSVRMASARSNINEDLTIRGFPVSSADFALNGMVGLAPYWRVPVEMAERIEIIKGPSSMLFGMAPSGNIGGMVNIVPKRAASDPLTRVTAGFRSDSVFGLHVDVGRRFGVDQAFGIRVNAARDQGDTPVREQATRQTLGSVGLDFRQRRVRASLDLLWSNDRIDNVNRQLSAGSTLTALPRVPSNKVSYPGFGWTDSRDGTTLAKVEVDLTSAVTGYLGYGQMHSNWGAIAANPEMVNTAGDFDYFGGWQRQHVVTRALEAGLRGQFATGPVKHQATVAYNRLDSDLDLGFYTGLPPGRSNLYSGRVLPTPSIDGISNPLQRYKKYDLSSFAVADTMSLLSDRLLLTLGLRRQQIEARDYNFRTGAPNGAPYDQGATTPLAGIVYKFTPALAVYGNYVEGLSRGDTAPLDASVTNAGAMLPPFKSKQKEVGLKVDAGRLAATLSLFELERPSTSVSDNVFGVNGRQRNRGIEANVFGEAAPGVRLLAGASYTRGRIVESPDPSLAGRDAISVPRLLVNLGADWDPGFVPGLTLSGRWIHTGASYMDAENRLEVPAWNRFDVGARYPVRIAGRPVLFRLNVENLFDKDYYGNSTGGYLFIGMPRTVMLSASIDL